jgi:predicted transcriptional regulator
MKKQIKIGVSDATVSARGFVEAWKRAEEGQKSQVEHRLYFQDLETLIKALTSARWGLLKTLRTNGPMSIRSLANQLGRDYKNVHTDVRRLEQLGLICYTVDEKVEVPWDVVEAQLKLAA